MVLLLRTEKDMGGKIVVVFEVIFWYLPAKTLEYPDES